MKKKPSNSLAKKLLLAATLGLSTLTPQEGLATNTRAKLRAFCYSNPKAQSGACMRECGKLGRNRTTAAKVRRKCGLPNPVVRGKKAPKKRKPQMKTRTNPNKLKTNTQTTNRPNANTPLLDEKKLTEAMVNILKKMRLKDAISRQVAEEVKRNKEKDSKTNLIWEILKWLGIIGGIGGIGGIGAIGGRLSTKREIKKDYEKRSKALISALDKVILTENFIKEAEEARSKGPEAFSEFVGTIITNYQVDSSILKHLSENLN